MPGPSKFHRASGRSAGRAGAAAARLSAASAITRQAGQRCRFHRQRIDDGALAASDDQPQPGDAFAAITFASTAICLQTPTHAQPGHGSSLCIGAAMNSGGNPVAIFTGWCRKAPICRASSAVEQRFCKPLVGGSIPSPGTTRNSLENQTFFDFSAAARRPWERLEIRIWVHFWVQSRFTGVAEEREARNEPRRGCAIRGSY